MRGLESLRNTTTKFQSQNYLDARAIARPGVLLNWPRGSGLGGSVLGGHSLLQAMAGGPSPGKMPGFYKPAHRENKTMKATGKNIGRLIVGCAFACCLSLFTLQAFTIEGLKISVQSSNAVLSWPSASNLHCSISEDARCKFFVGDAHQLSSCCNQCDYDDFFQLPRKHKSHRFLSGGARWRAFVRHHEWHGVEWRGQSPH